MRSTPYALAAVAVAVLSVPAVAQAQPATRTITGTVVDAAGESPLGAAQIQVRGTTLGAGSLISITREVER